MRTLFHKSIIFSDAVTKASNFFKAILNAEKYLAANRILPTVKIIQNLNPLEKELIITMSRELLFSENKTDSILAARILAKLRDPESIPLYLKKLETEQDVYYLVKAISTSLDIIQIQKQVFQNAFHQEGDVYEHSKLVCKSAIKIISYFTNTISGQLSNFPNQIDIEVQQILNKLICKTVAGVSSVLEKEIDGISRGKLLVLCAFLHDIGKPKTATPKLTQNNEFKLFDLKSNYYIEQKFPDHETIGALLFLGVANQIGLTEKQTTYIYELIKSHKDITDAVKNARKTDEQRIDTLHNSLIKITGKYKQLDIFYDAVLLYLADSLGKTGELSFSNDIAELKEAFFEILKLESAQ